MKVENLLANIGGNYEDIANILGLTVENGKVYPGSPVDFEDFKTAVNDYIEEYVESGNNSSMLLDRLLVDDDEREVLKEMIFNPQFAH